MISSILSEAVQWKIAEVSNVLLLALSLPSVLAPHLDNKFYTSKDYKTKDKTTLNIVYYAGQIANLATTSLSLVWWCNAKKGLTPEQAIGVGAVPPFVFALYLLLNDVPKTLGRTNM